MKKVLFFLILLSECVFAQLGNPGEESKSFVVPTFYLEALANKSAQAGLTRLDVYIQVPFANVQFVRKDTIFSASYSVTLTIYDENKENIYFDQNWEEKLKTNDFEEANSPFSSNYSMRTMDLKPGKYTLYCSIEDRDSKKLVYNEALLTVRGFSEPVEIGDALLIGQIIKDNNGEEMIPNVSRVVTNKTSELPIYFEIFSDKDQAYKIEYTMKGLKGDTLYIKTEDRALKAGINKIDYTLKDIKFSLGQIQLGIKVFKEGMEVKSYIKLISGRIYGLPPSIVSLDDAIDEMQYVAGGATLNFIRKSVTNEEKLKKFFDFWDTKKPLKELEENPVMKEYYKRVDYSNRHFKGRPSGWKSDMGMVYIILGPPDIIERQPMPMSSTPYEIWTYSHLNRQYQFQDVGGFGSYVLQNPDYDIINGGNLK